MSPRSQQSSSSASKNASSPYSKRPTGQPKSSRQQFSACGACRMRRVRCDLKDLPFTAVGPHPSCSNCKERGLKCVDEFADVKAVKLLRRGRRLQQVEAIYGKIVGPDGSSSSSPPATRLPSIIPQLSTEFFSSPFWKWFTVHRPVLDPIEFSTRFIAHTKGVQSLGHEGGLLAMVLVVWAASFGLDERGKPDPEDAAFSDVDMSMSNPSSSSTKGSPHLDSKIKGKNISPEKRRKAKKERTDLMLREILELIDFHGIMRRPSWDGVRVLLLIVPLLEDANPLERLAIYEATLSHTQALCTLSASPSGSSAAGIPFPDGTDDSLIRARIFWYAHMHEGISTGMRGGRLVLDSDDLEAFQHTLPPYTFGLHSHVLNGPSPPSSSRPMSSHGFQTQQSNSHRSLTTQAFLKATEQFAVPIQLSAVCRKVHNVLTGAKAARRAEEHSLIHAHGMHEIWEDLDHCWKEFDAMRQGGSSEDEALDLDLFASAWQICIFECREYRDALKIDRLPDSITWPDNIIRESLKQCMTRSSSTPHALYPGGSPPRPSSHSSSSPYLPPHHLHAIATRKCLNLLPIVLRIIKIHLMKDHGTRRHDSLFKWDSGLVRDGCFFAGFLAASFEGDIIDSPTDDRDDDLTRSRSRMTAEEGVALCLTALAEMRWAFSRSEEREETVRMVWENRQVGRNTGRYPLNANNIVRIGPGMYPDLGYTNKSISPMPHTSHGYPSMSGGQDRPLLPPLRSPRRVESAPNSSYTTTGQGASGWPSYTPPGTATSVATSAGTGISARSSPLFNSIAPPMTFKGEHQESLYHVTSDMDHFSFHPPGPALGSASNMGNDASSYHRDTPSSTHSLHTTPSSTFLDPGVFASSASSMLHPTSEGQNCPQFGDNCNAYYH